MAWEDQISINSFGTVTPGAIGRALEYQQQTSFLAPDSLAQMEEIERYMTLDQAPLPDTAEREGYCGERHFEYWLTGLRDYLRIHEVVSELGSPPLGTYLDLGCATGRVVRHFAAYDSGVQTIGCDINAQHVAWCNRYLPRNALVFQNTSIPVLPLPDNSVDFVSGFSVFTHIEAFETSWLMEIRRVLRPGGLAYLTVHTENTMKSLNPSWPLYGGLSSHPNFDDSLMGAELQHEKVIFRYAADRSYTSNVFMHSEYIRRVWGRILEVLEVRKALNDYQDVVILRK